MLQKVKWPSQLDRLRSVVEVQEKRWVCYSLIHEAMLCILVCKMPDEFVVCTAHSFLSSV